MRIVARNGGELFGEELPPDNDPRWKQMDEWMEKLEREKEQEFQREDEEMEQKRRISPAEY